MKNYKLSAEVDLGHDTMYLCADFIEEKQGYLLGYSAASVLVFCINLTKIVTVLISEKGTNENIT